MSKEKCIIINDSNTGLKFSIFDYQKEEKIASGKCVGIGTYNCFITLIKDNLEIKERVNIRDKEDMLFYLANFLINYNVITNPDEVNGIGYHFIDGGDIHDSILVDDNLRYFVLNYYDKSLPILVFQKCFMKAKTVISFDSTFYKRKSSINYHGLSYQYIEEKMKLYHQKDDINVIACHLGNTSSVCLISDETKKIAKKADIVMDNFLYTSIDAKIGFIEAHKLLNQYISFIIETITEYYLTLGGDVDSIIFTGGIGENSSLLRKEIISNLPDYINVKIDDNKNNSIGEDKEKKQGIISEKSSIIPVMVIPNGEDIIIFNEMKDLIKYNSKVKMLTKKKLVL